MKTMIRDAAELVDSTSRGFTWGNFVGGVAMLFFGLADRSPALLVLGSITFTGAVANLRWPR